MTFSLLLTRKGEWLHFSSLQWKGDGLLPSRSRKGAPFFLEKEGDDGLLSPSFQKEGAWPSLFSLKEEGGLPFFSLER